MFQSPMQKTLSVSNNDTTLKQKETLSVHCPALLGLSRHLSFEKKSFCESHSGNHFELWQPRDDNQVSIVSSLHCLSEWDCLAKTRLPFVTEHGHRSAPFWTEAKPQTCAHIPCWLTSAEQIVLREEYLTMVQWWIHLLSLPEKEPKLEFENRLLIEFVKVDAWLILLSFLDSSVLALQCWSNQWKWGLWQQAPQISLHLLIVLLGVLQMAFSVSNFSFEHGLHALVPKAFTHDHGLPFCGISTFILTHFPISFFLVLSGILDAKQAAKPSDAFPVTDILDMLLHPPLNKLLCVANAFHPCIGAGCLVDHDQWFASPFAFALLLVSAVAGWFLKI